jgi:hypothetical protein
MFLVLIYWNIILSLFKNRLIWFSGITSLQKRAMVAIRCSIRMEVPLGQIDELVVSPEYVRYLVRIANSKMEANKRRMNGFLDLLQTKVLSYFVLLCSLYCRSLFFVSFHSKNVWKLWILFKSKNVSAECSLSWSEE